MSHQQTLSVIEADVGSNTGHLRPRTEIVSAVTERIEDRHRDLIDDHEVYTRTRMGKHDRYLIGRETVWSAGRGHRHGEWNVSGCIFTVGDDIDLLADVFAGNVKSLAPGACEFAFEEREAEPFLAFGADRTELGAFNQPMYRSMDSGTRR